MAKKRYTDLTDQQLFDGIRACYNNGLNHFNNALFNSENHGLGIALFVISIEELIKANALYHCYIGLEEQETIEIAFNSKDKHRTRLKMALGLNSSHQLMEQLDVVSNIEKKVLNSNLELNLGDLFNPERMKSFYEQSQELLKDDIEELKESSEEIKKEFEQHTNWFLHAQHKKEKGFYADLTNNKWEVPSSLTAKDYQEAKSHSTPIFEQISGPIKTIVEASNPIRNLLRSTAKNFIEMAKTDDNNTYE
ncbi:MAG: AbiV family abortive infection protein [Cyclobacteriaceae bacterium]|jgi:AbiV family abortive infection protein